MRPHTIAALLVAALAAAPYALVATQSGAPAPAAQEERKLPLELVKMAPGFSIDIYAGRVPRARQLAIGSKGTVFVGSRNKDAGGVVHALVDKDGDQKADRVVTIAKGLTDPNGVAFRDGSLYVAEIGRVIRFDKIEDNLDAPPAFTVVNDTLPKDAHHGQKFIAFGPDGLLYVPVGAPCNVCERDNPQYSTILRMKPDGTGLEVFASGVRNTVGFDWHPRTRELWFTDNGRDMMGDDVPSDELNMAPKGRPAFRVPLLPSGRCQRSRVRSEEAVQRVPGAGAQARCARRGNRDALLHRQDVPRGVPEPDHHRRAWLVEPVDPAGLPAVTREDRSQQGVVVHTVRGGVAARIEAGAGGRSHGWRRVGPAGRRARHARRRAARLRRQRRGRLPHQLQEVTACFE
jgi:hypothetical protein